ncbi:MAG: type III-B CRISPR-associated protein Cas10/Cmr2 [Spirochaetales bacterium]
MKFPYNDANYWEQKIIAYFHDSPEKIFNIAKHEERSTNFIATLGLQKPNNEVYKLADIIAAGLERGLFPDYHRDEEKSGAIDYEKNPYLTHPISLAEPLKVLLPQKIQLEDTLSNFIKILLSEEQQKLADKKILFFYLYFLLKFKLASSNIANLGAFWHRIPADTRIPDHGIWHHNALTSALYSCTYHLEQKMHFEELLKKAGLLVFSITPVQGFISNARRLRDYWTGSVLLSWLAFEGIRWIMENLGPDHVLYPCLHDQPLVNIYLEKYFGFKLYHQNMDEERNTIASFPNKFVALIPFQYAEEIATEIQKHIQKEWENLLDLSHKYLCTRMLFKESSEEARYLRELFRRQAEVYWSYDWAAVRFIQETDKEQLSKLLLEKHYQKNIEFITAFQKLLKNRSYTKQENYSLTFFYNTTHSLVQGLLSAAKRFRQNRRKAEPGEKCSLCGEFEALHTKPWQEGEEASQYKQYIQNFWETLGEKWENELDFSQKKRKEFLCSLCFMKRGLYKILEKENHPLKEVFNNQEGFPLTTEIALTHYLDKKNIKEKKERQKISQKIHDSNKEPMDIKNIYKYYALLLMDGDNMGKLVSGETIGATWNSIIQNELKKKLKGEKGKIEEIYRNAWKDILGQSRMLTPAIHESISEALGDFALYCVAPIVKNYKGKLIYAGGDDVCAFLPLQNALQAAKEIRDAYHHTFRYIDPEGTFHPLSGDWEIKPGKLSLGLGTSKDISISAALLFVHHKENLKWCIKEAHRILDEIAKEQNGRNSLAVGLYKRSGGEPKIYVRKWEEEGLGKEQLSPWESVKIVTTAIASAKKPRELSRSLIYNLESLKPALISFTKLSNKEEAKDGLTKFVLAQMDRSSIEARNPKELAEHIVNIIWNKQKTADDAISTNGLIIASFLANQ